MTEPTNNQWLYELQAEIHFKQDSIPSIHAGKLTDKTRQVILSKLETIEQEAYKLGLSHANK